MNLPPGYELVSILRRGTSRMVYRARELASGDRVIIKSVLDLGERTRAPGILRHEHRMLSRLEVPAVAGTRDLLYHDGRHHLVMDDLGGVSLKHMDGGRNVPICPGSFAWLDR